MVYRRTQWVSIARRWWVSGRADSQSTAGYVKLLLPPRQSRLPMIEGATGKFMLQQMAAIAELEAGMISKRTKDALAAAKRRGVKLGGDRGARLTAKQRQRAGPCARSKRVAVRSILHPPSRSYSDRRSVIAGPCSRPRRARHSCGAWRQMVFSAGDAIAGDHRQPFRRRRRRRSRVRRRRRPRKA